ncbi:hypothetical protein ABT275_45760 [Streptomyces sp. NPDC001185]|uniref:hypothetical protein n=1 Tax=Streptomyces sp. NPDC001185 TaxID=3154380 RepID=UPI00331797DF
MEYDRWGQLAKSVITGGSQTSTITMITDDAGRAVTRTATGTSDQAPPKATTSYDPATGKIVAIASALIVLGLARHGLTEQAETVTEGLITAAAHHGDRLPEVMAGCARTDTGRPVPYPHSCSPQAWAEATPLALRSAREGRIH